MANDRFRLRTWFMILLGCVISILLVMAFTSIWSRSFREAFLFATVGVVLTLLFYRKKLTLLAAVTCGWVLISSGLTALFHPSVIGFLLLLSSVSGLAFFSRRVAKQHPGLLPDDWQRVFDRK